MLDDFENLDILIFRCGTSIGLPTSILTKGVTLGINFTNGFDFHQPAYRSSSRLRRFKSWNRVRSRISIKYLLFVTGQYKARANRRELGD